MESYISNGEIQSGEMCFDSVFHVRQKAAYLKHTGIDLAPDTIAFSVSESKQPQGLPTKCAH